MMPGNTRDNLNYGGKIVMPPSALNKLTMLSITYPMLFELKSEEMGLISHAGVLEFIAEEGRVYLPQWMMETLALSPGSLLQISSTDLPSGTFVRIEPQSVDFLDISDPKAVLENALRNFTTLTVDDVFQIHYNDKIYSIKVLEVKPESDSNSICVVETDLEVDFAPPVGYVEPSRTASAASSGVPSRQTATPVGSMAKSIKYENLAKSTVKKAVDPFAGSGQKLSGKSIAHSTSSSHSEPPTVADPLQELPSIDAPPLNLPFGQLFFGYPIIPVKNTDAEKEREDKENMGARFSGSGQSLRQNRKRKDDNPPASTSPKAKPKTYSDVIEID